MGVTQDKDSLNKSFFMRSVRAEDKSETASSEKTDNPRSGVFNEKKAEGKTSGDYALGENPSVSNAAMTKYLSRRVSRGKDGPDKDSDLYDADVVNNLTTMEYERRGMMSNYSPSKRELRDNTVPKQFFKLSTDKGNFFVGKYREKDEFLMTSVLSNAKGQSLKFNEQRTFDSSRKRERRIGSQRIMKANNAGDDGAVAIATQRKDLNTRRLADGLGKVMNRDRNLGSLEKTVPFLNGAKESQSIEALRERIGQLEDMPRSGSGTEVLDKEKRSLEIKLEKCKNALMAKERMKNTFVKTLNEAADSFDKDKDKAPDEDEQVKVAAAAILLNNMYDEGEGDEEEEGKDKGIVKKAVKKGGKKSGVSEKKADRLLDEIENTNEG